VVVTVEWYRIYLPLVVRQASSGAEVIAPPSLVWSRRPSRCFQRALPAEAAVIQAGLASGDGDAATSSSNRCRVLLFSVLC
jgi:hypothetical protein